MITTTPQRQKTDGCKNNPETKVSKHIASGFSMSIISSFRSIKIKNKHDVYRGKGCRSFVNS